MHVPVLAGPAIDWLRVQQGGSYVDCTAGVGGHTERIAQLAGGGRVVALDRDPAAAKAAADRLQGHPNVTVVHANYANLRAVLQELGLDAVDGILLDAGLSSAQLDDAQRGFSFQREGPLDMRMDPTSGEPAEVFLKRQSAEELGRVLKGYGDVRRHRKLAKTIVEQAHAGRLNTTTDLAGCVRRVVRDRNEADDETRKTFQAIRIAVNDELKALEVCTRDSVDLLAPGGRYVAITFHSGEDRIVKNILREASRPEKELYPDGRIKRVIPPRIRVLTRRPVEPSAEEIALNSRAHSAKLRAAERLAYAG